MLIVEELIVTQVWAIHLTGFALALVQVSVVYPMVNAAITIAVTVHALQFGPKEAFVIFLVNLCIIVLLDLSVLPGVHLYMDIQC